MAKMVIKMISETEAQVTKAFAKNAVIFGTEEYKLWREYRKDFPDAKMVTKTIKKNPEKVQSNPYKAVLAWFLATFENYSTYKTFFKELEEKEKAAKEEFVA